MRDEPLITERTHQVAQIWGHPDVGHQTTELETRLNADPNTGAVTHTLTMADSGTGEAIAFWLCDTATAVHLRDTLTQMIELATDYQINHLLRTGTEQ